jgi:hypothetical protein
MLIYFILDILICGTIRMQNVNLIKYSASRKNSNMSSGSRTWKYCRLVAHKVDDTYCEAVSELFP